MKSVGILLLFCAGIFTGICGMIISPSLEFKGNVSSINPAGEFPADYISLSSSDLWTMPELYIHKAEYRFKRYSHSGGGLVVYNTNDLLTRITFAPFYSYDFGRLSAGIMPSLHYAYYSDGHTDVTAGILAGSRLSRDMYYSEIMLGYKDRYRGYMETGLETDDYSVYITGSLDNDFTYGAGIDFRINHYLNTRFSIDSQKRIEAGAGITILPFYVSYAYIESAELGMSHSVTFRYYFPADKIHAVEIDVPDEPVLPDIDIDKPIPFNINTADVGELMRIPGIGRKTAMEIYEKRILTGGFDNYQQIDSISGIGDKTLRIIKEYTYIME
ncbi:MAG: helix-hairpin-helix domain-containing protein [bacterium]